MARLKSKHNGTELRAERLVNGHCGPLLLLKGGADAYPDGVLYTVLKAGMYFY